MPVLSVVLLIAGGIMLARSVLFWLYWIQTKDNRLDRIWLKIKTRDFLRLILSAHRMVVLVLLIMWFTQLSELLYVRDRLLSPILIVQLVTAVYIFMYAMLSIIAGVKRKLRLPRLTRKALVLLIATLTIDGLLLIGARNPSVPLLLTELAQPIIVLGIFSLVYTPNIFLHHYFINRARKKIAAHKNLIVIGITGSYGKTSTKEYLAHILSKKYKVLKTPAHINVDTGVAKVILRDLKSEHEIFIVEMGAYRKGEIQKICALVQPKYALLTGLSDQHLELFGSLKAISAAKFELIDAVDEPSMIIANSDSKPLIIEFERRSITPVWYGLSERAVLKARNPKLTAEGLSFEINNTPFRGLVFGMACLNNLLGAITMAQNLGMSLDEITKAIGTLCPVPHTMELKSGPGSALLIDDTYNANTEGVLTAIQDLQYTARPKRIMVFSEVIELGDQAEEDHARIVEAILKHATHLMLLPSGLQKFIKDKLITGGYSAAQFISTTAELKTLLDKDAVILFEGRDAQKLLNSL